ncbi:hypothetical protein M9Y10_030679 [Tritrichomonas musculus]|uniref:DUF3447 domain-containing protein n=1 Tax=Tritrichomonas musculus TaxID=1915356 RepID=A0ABR2H2N4_9EUKA
MCESDNIATFLKKFKNVQDKFLYFLENDENIDENFQNLKKLFIVTKLRDSQHDLKLFLRLLLKVTNNYHRGPIFFGKIFQILQLFKDDIKKYKNDEIFQLFKSNKRILLFLIEEQILTVDEYFVKQIIKEKYLAKEYPQYFAPEIRPYLNEKWFPEYNSFEEDLEENEWVEQIKEVLPDNFYELRKIGENDNYLCKLIREDSVIDFISYVNKSCISLNKIIEPSIYETNSFLVKKQKNTTLIEYAAFFGSIQIFNYLKFNKVNLKPSLWIDVIHSKNAELIHLLEDNHIDPIISVVKNDEEIKEGSFKECFNESIKCHHNDIANYFLQNYLQNENEIPNETIIKYYNFAFLQKENVNEYFCYLCYYDYYSLSKVILTSRDVNINGTAIQIVYINKIQNHVFQLDSKSFFQWNSKSYLSIKLKTYLSIKFKIIFSKEI